MRPREFSGSVSFVAKRAAWSLHFMVVLPMAIPQLGACSSPPGGGEISARRAHLSVGNGDAGVDSGDASSSETVALAQDQVRLAPDELHDLTRKLLSSEDVDGWESLSEAGVYKITEIWTKNPPTVEHQSALSLKDESSLKLLHDKELQTNDAYQEYAAIIAKASLDPEERGSLKALLIEGKAEEPPKEQVEP